MSLLYKKPEEINYSVTFKGTGDGKVNIVFTADCGKFGTDEQLDEYTLTVHELLTILQSQKLDQPH